MSKHLEYMELAVKLAIKGMKRGHGGPFGAVIVRNDEIVGRGWNQSFKKTDPTAHAEVQAIRDACKKLDTLELAGCVMYSSGEPCPMCMAAIYWSFMDGVYFANTKEEAALVGFDDSKIYKELSLSWKERAIDMAHMPNEQAAMGFKMWEAQKRKDQL